MIKVVECTSKERVVPMNQMQVSDIGTVIDPEMYEGFTYQNSIVLKTSLGVIELHRYRTNIPHLRGSATHNCELAVCLYPKGTKLTLEVV